MIKKGVDEMPVFLISDLFQTSNAKGYLKYQSFKIFFVQAKVQILTSLKILEIGPCQERCRQKGAEARRVFAEATTTTNMT